MGVFMANADVQDTLNKVLIARKAVGEARTLPSLTPEQYELLDTTYSQLADLEDQLGEEDLKQSVQTLQRGAQKLSDLCNELSASIDALAKIASAIDDAAKAISALTSILATAAGAKIV
jgi:methanogenic corrinoid protein MtbC1